eukprot:g25273.t1
MRPDSPTHEQGLQEEQKSDQQDEISIEQSLADDQDTNLSTGPIPSSDFTAPEEPHTDPNRSIESLIAPSASAVQSDLTSDAMTGNRSSGLMPRIILMGRSIAASSLVSCDTGARQTSKAYFSLAPTS